jgi:hypothetical protein
VVSSDVRYEEVDCDVVIAGGSTAALAASLAAARTAPAKKICLVESTNWPGIINPLLPLAHKSHGRDAARRLTATTRARSHSQHPGGQLTSSAVSAVDFGNHNRHPENQPKVLLLIIYRIRQTPDDDVSPLWRIGLCRDGRLAARQSGQLLGLDLVYVHAHASQCCLKGINSR